MSHQDQLIAVWDAQTDSVRHVSPAQAFHGMLDYGRSLGEPSPAAAVAIQRALAFGREHGLTLGPVRKPSRRRLAGRTP